MSGETMLERMALAMIRAAGEDSAGWNIDDRLGPSLVRVDGLVDFLAVAKAALLAIREPSEAMMEVSCPLGPSHRSGQWQAMVQAILAEEV